MFYLTWDIEFKSVKQSQVFVLLQTFRCFLIGDLREELENLHLIFTAWRIYLSSIFKNLDCRKNHGKHKLYYVVFLYTDYKLKTTAKNGLHILSDSVTLKKASVPSTLSFYHYINLNMQMKYHFILNLK